MIRVCTVFVVLALCLAPGLSVASTPEVQTPVWWDDYREAMARLDADDAAAAQRLLSRALEQRPHPSRRTPGDDATGPYVPYLQMARVYLRRGNVEDAELSLTISATFEAYREHRPSRALFQALTDAVEQARITKNGATEAAPSSNPR